MKQFQGCQEVLLFQNISSVLPTLFLKSLTFSHFWFQAPGPKAPDVALTIAPGTALNIFHNLFNIQNNPMK